MRRDNITLYPRSLVMVELGRKQPRDKGLDMDSSPSSISLRRRCRVSSSSLPSASASLFVVAMLCLARQYPVTADAPGTCLRGREGCSLQGEHSAINLIGEMAWADEEDSEGKTGLAECYL